ncbi:hypothetical protein REPUB_Repub04eG0177300 [Reevesia pubescens]
MNQIDVEDQVSVTMNNDEISDANSTSNNVIEINSGYAFEFFAKNGLVNIEASNLANIESTFHDSIIRRSFFSGMGPNSEFVKKIKIVAIHKNMNSSWSGKARAQTHGVFEKAVADKCGGDANVKYAWYGASWDEISKILIHGFDWYRKPGPANQDCYRRSISLSPAKFSIDGVLSSEVDDNGLGHLLLCRVILGKQEVMTADSNQCHPSSPEFDSGVDDLSAPRKYIIWSTYLNSHILPVYIISFKAPSLRGFKGLLEANTNKPPKPFIKFSTLISMLSKFLGPSQMASLNKQYADVRENKITKQQMIKKLKEIAGDHLLAAVVDSYINKCAGT